MFLDTGKMKKFFYTVIFLLSLCLVWSCAKESFVEHEEESGDDVELVAPDGYEIVEFQVTSEPSKTTLNGESSTRAVEWTKGDMIDIFWTPVDEESGTVTATATAAGPITQFRAVVPVGVTDFYATYPAGVGSYAEGQLKVRMPSEFNGTFAASNLMAAKLSRTEASVFQSVVSLLRFEVTDSDANSIRVSCRDTEVAKALRGVLPVSFDAGGIVSVGTDTRTGDKTGDDNEKMTFAGAGVYYLPILADTEIQNGLFVEYFKNNIVVASLDVDFNFQLGRSYVADFGVIENILKPEAHHEYYVTLSGAGTKNGSSWANAFGLTEFKNIITRYAPKEGYDSEIATEKEDALRNALFRIGGGTYNLGEVVDLGFSNHCTRFINFTFDGGYNSATGNKNPSNPTIFTGGDSHCIFQLSRFADLGVIDCNFEQSSGTTGGAAAVRMDSKYARLTLNGCNFNNNANTNTAGALSLGFGTATVMNCAFNNNSASIGAAISIDNGDDAAIYQTGAISISGCTFNGNTATDGVGGAVRIDSGGPVSIENSAFTNNTGNNGGALYVKNVREKLVVTGCTFGTSGNGNSSSSDGGAIRVADGSAVVELTNCTFTDNNSASSAGGISLQTSFSGTVTVSGGSFTNCSASTNGGAIYHGSGTLVVDGATFDGCSADQYGGVYGITENSDGNAQFKNCDMGKTTRNHAAQRGGCIHMNSDNVTSTSHTFTDCWISGDVSGSGDENGGGARSGKGAPSFTRCTFDSCTTTKGSAAYHIAGSSSPIFTNCTFSNCSSSGDGGAVKIASTGAPVFTSCTFSNCTSSGHGGAVSVAANGAPTFTSCTFSDCSNTGSSKNGGAVYLAKAENHPAFDGCHFINCVSKYGGGAIYSLSTYTGGITISGCEFEGCYAPEEGGALDLRSTSAAVYYVTDCNFHDNYGPWGTLFTEGEEDGYRLTVNISGGTFSSNLGMVKSDKSYQPGTIFVNYRTTLNISGTDFNGNTASTGACVYLRRSDSIVNCSNATFRNNTATGNGGVFSTGEADTKLYCDGSTFDANKAQSSAVYYSNFNVACAYFNSCVFKNNHWTSDYGGVIRAEESKTIKYGFNNCSFLKNVSQISSVSNNYVGCWFNLGNFSGSILFSNSSITGQPENDPTNNGVKASGFMRVEKMATANRLKFVNTIIANTRTSGTTYGAAFTLRSGSAGYTPNFNANWCIFSDWVNQSNASGLTLTGTGNLGGDQSTHVIGNTTWFPSWGWKKLPGTTDYDYAGFNSLPEGFTPTALDNVNEKIQEEDSAFYDWLSSIGALDKDIRGYTRAAITWPGVYDMNATSN